MDRTSAGWLVVAPVGFHASALAVHVPRSRPIGETPIWPVLIAPLRDDIENPVNPVGLLAAATESRIGVVDLAGLVLVVGAIARDSFLFRRIILRLYVISDRDFGC